MKQKKKHQFAHVDPEKTKSTNVESNDLVFAPEKEDRVPDFVYRDLVRTGIIIGAFVALIIALYVIQLKTNWLAPVLKIFGV